MTVTIINKCYWQKVKYGNTNNSNVTENDGNPSDNISENNGNTNNNNISEIIIINVIIVLVNLVQDINQLSIVINVNYVYSYWM